MKHQKKRKKYKVMKREVLRKQKDEKREWAKELFNIPKGDSKKLWSAVRAVNGGGVDNSPSSLLVNGVSITKSKEIAKSLNTFFVDKVEKLVQSLPAKVNDIEETLKTSQLATDVKCHLFEISLEQLRGIVRKMKTSNASGPDSISSRVIKDCLPIIEDCLLHLANLSLGTGNFPACLKVAKVIPMLKPGKDPMDQASFRPISNLSTVGKIIEKNGFMQIMKHINGLGLINKRQHGGRKGMSTNTCVLEVLNEVNKAREKKMMVGILAVDMSAAYDLINHKILLQKLRIMGLAPHTLKWVQDFLSTRKQCVDICGNMSDSISTGEQGVVQGGASSGDLFLIYLNNIPECNPRPGHHILEVSASQYVDDVTLVVYAKTKTLLQKALQSSYLNIERDLSDHRMVINGGKTQLMIVGKNKELKSTSITAANQTITHQENLKILGITLSASLKFDHHIKEGNKSLTKAIFSKMSILKNVKPNVDTKTLASIGDSLISSTILFGAPIWSQTSDANISLVQRAQTKAARMITGMSSWGFKKKRSHRQDIFNQLGWKNTKQLIATANLNMLKNAIENKTSVSLHKMFRINQPAHPRGIITNRVDHTGSATRSKLCFEVQAAKEYNGLPDPLRSPLLTPKDFKALLKDHILTIHNLPIHNNN